MPPLEEKLPFLFKPDFYYLLRKNAGIRIDPIVLCIDKRSLREPGTLEAMCIQALSIVSVFLTEGLHLRVLPGHWSDSSMALLCSKVHREPKQFHPLHKNLLENVPGNEIDVERAGKCNPACHLLS
jgi:hypothetical protein